MNMRTDEYKAAKNLLVSDDINNILIGFMLLKTVCKLTHEQIKREFAVVLKEKINNAKIGVTYQGPYYNVHFYRFASEILYLKIELDVTLYSSEYYDIVVTSSVLGNTKFAPKTEEDFDKVLLKIAKKVYNNKHKLS